MASEVANGLAWSGLVVPLGGSAVLRVEDGRVGLGRVLGVIGPNGSGKTTLLRVWAGLGESTSGKVLAGSEDVRGLGERARARRIALIPQRIEASEAFDAASIAGMGGHALGEGEGAARALGVRALERLGAGHLARRAFGALSVGERQRVACARALAQAEGFLGSGVILADEPTSAMDPRHALACIAALREVAERGHAVVMVMHDVARALASVDEVLMLERAGEGGARGGRTLASADVPAADLERVFGVRFVECEAGGERVRAGWMRRLET